MEVTGEDGVVTTVRPEQAYYYDLGGRLVGSEDANGHRTVRSLVAGTGYGDAEALVAVEYHADGGVVRYGHDGFGDRVWVADALGRRTTMSHDRLGRVLTVTRPGAGVERYAYDELGREIRHWNDLVGAEGAEWTDYDVQGRVTRKRAYGGDETRTAYSWSATAAAVDLGASPGGWVETVSFANGKTRRTTRTMFGQVTESVDLGGAVSTYGYDRGGRQIWRATDGETVATLWFNTGLAARQSSDLGTKAGRAVALYDYDAAGRRVRERFTQDGVTYQDGRAQYDGSRYDGRFAL